MGLEQFSEKADIDGSTTILELIDIFGEEAVRRGIEYMDSLKEADKEYRNSAGDSDYSRNLKEEISPEGEKEPDSEEDVEKKWARSMKEEGIGIDE